ncbi:MAG: polyphosphate kinase 1 [Saprospiraceae bacterium]|nr:polyphosphate kinase 1 [Saprospiraceae bacterium]MBK8372846.1 polyphosphate kinase 1 [Saprospiraceae bacterium]MBK8549021.1 polyphosphate kinase 1 [Saprospiraceae bacterium]MBK9043587.1 polyphosphate kinase 1 [Saprospiraceae bacterium]
MSKQNRYVHRDISWLSFNYRVLQEAKDVSVPLLERLKFLAIYSSNLDEFFRVRVANHRSLARADKATKKTLDFNPEDVLNELLDLANKHQLEFSNIFENMILPELRKNNIQIISRKNLTKEQIEFIDTYFNDNMLPFVQPVVLVGKKVKPFLNDGALYLALHMHSKDVPKPISEYALVKIPSDHMSRFLELPSKSSSVKQFIMLDDAVRHSVRLIFPGYEIQDSFSIKLTRDAELYIDDEYKGDLLAKIKKSVSKRSTGLTSRMVYDRTMPKHFLDYLMYVFDLERLDLLPEGRYHNNSDFFKFPDFGKQNLKDQKLLPVKIMELEESESIFDKIAQKDYMIHVPYHSYEPVIKFFEDAANDPEVTHIKVIQYRVAKVSRIMMALKNAVKNGKQVSTFIEVKARFDEEANLKWGEELESAGVSVFYSMPGYKVHSKIALVRRLENGKPTLFTYLSTGNFHEDTAKVYSDFGLFTSDKRITSEAARVFTFLETKQRPIEPFEHLGIGLFNLKEKFIALIDREIKNAKNRKKASMILKMNSIQDKEMIEKLYEASEAGVKIKMIIRGICCLIPGIKGLSENIEAISIVDRYLEHSRIFVFHNDGQEEVYLSSADWMVRNLHFRVETLFPILDEEIVKSLMTCLQIQINDNVKARIIDEHQLNTYKKYSSDIAVRSQIETYFYIKRKEESKNLQDKTILPQN